MALCISAGSGLRFDRCMACYLCSATPLHITCILAAGIRHAALQNVASVRGHKLIQARSHSKEVSLCMDASMQEGQISGPHLQVDD